VEARRKRYRRCSRVARPREAGPLRQVTNSPGAITRRCQNENPLHTTEIAGDPYDLRRRNVLDALFTSNSWLRPACRAPFSQHRAVAPVRWVGLLPRSSAAFCCQSNAPRLRRRWTRIGSGILGGVHDLGLHTINGSALSIAATPLALPTSFPCNGRSSFSPICKCAGRSAPACRPRPQQFSHFKPLLRARLNERVDLSVVPQTVHDLRVGFPRMRECDKP